MSIGFELDKEVGELLLLWWLGLRLFDGLNSCVTWVFRRLLNWDESTASCVPSDFCHFGLRGYEGRAIRLLRRIKEEERAKSSMYSVVA
jgi:hypothetical protein